MNTLTQPCKRISEFEDQDHDVTAIDRVCICTWTGAGLLRLLFLNSLFLVSKQWEIASSEIRLQG